jgi:hypothetical protein
MNLANISRINVPRRLLNETSSAIRAAAVEGDELFVFWSGAMRGNELIVEHVLCPPQRCEHHPDGLAVVIGGDALHTQSAWLAKHGQLLAVQLHAHPSDAFHSESDDRHAVVTQTGAVSIVLSNFGRSHLFDPTTNAYQLGPTGWRRLSGEAFIDLVRVLD